MKKYLVKIRDRRRDFEYRVRYIVEYSLYADTLVEAMIDDGSLNLDELEENEAEKIYQKEIYRFTAALHEFESKLQSTLKKSSFETIEVADGIEFTAELHYEDFGFDVPPEEHVMRSYVYDRFKQIAAKAADSAKLTDKEKKIFVEFINEGIDSFMIDIDEIYED